MRSLSTAAEAEARLRLLGHVLAPERVPPPREGEHCRSMHWARVLTDLATVTGSSSKSPSPELCPSTAPASAPASFAPALPRAGFHRRRPWPPLGMMSCYGTTSDEDADEEENAAALAADAVALAMERKEPPSPWAATPSTLPSTSWESQTERKLTPIPSTLDPKVLIASKVFDTCALPRPA